MIHLGDITKINGAEITPVDVICGGSPCQDLSVANTRRDGLDGERSGLFMEQIRIIKEMREHDRSNGRADKFIRPRFMVLENVPGALSSKDGEDFRIVLEETARVSDKDAVIPGPPKGGWKKAGCIVADRWSIAWRIHDAQFWGVPQRRNRIALVADFRGQSAPEILFERKSVSGDSESGEEERKTTAGSVRKSTHSSVYDARGNGDGTVVPTLTGDHLNRVTDYTGICVNGTVSGTIDASYFKECGERNGVERDVVVQTNWDGTQTAPTLTKNNAGGNQRMPDKENFNCVLQAFGYYKESESASSLKQRDYKDATDLIVSKDKMTMTVRRLTPLETERLQGFPDGWTDIGEWVDANGKVRQTTDSTRYRAIGNSIALPYWKVLARKIAAQYDRDITMGSLFDGIGGFPLAFEHCGAKAIWASEIEDFCIAVTKKHFTEEDVN